jgi:hypothetical protein
MTMRLSSAVAVLLFAVAARGQDADKARAVVERAVQAQGGAEALSLELASHRKSKGAFVGENFRFEGESFSEPGGKRRVTLRGVMDGMPTTRNSASPSCR